MDENKGYPMACGALVMPDFMSTHRESCVECSAATLISSDTLGARLVLPSGRHMTLAHTSSMPIVNSFVNLTGSDITLRTAIGNVVVAASGPPLEVEYERSRRRATVIASTSPAHAETIEMLNDLTAPPRSINLNVFERPRARGFATPLPPLPDDCPGAFVTAEVARVIQERGSPYAKDEDEDEEKRPAKRQRRRDLDIYVVRDDAESLECYDIGL